MSLDNYTFKLISQLIKYQNLNCGYDVYHHDKYCAVLLQLQENGYTKKEIEQMTKEVRNFYKRLQRCREKVSILLKKECYFYTFTFTDAVLNTTTEKTRRRYITRLLRRSNYVANIDFGKKNAREHYHAISDVYLETYPYGFYTAIKIRLDYDEVGNCTTLSRLSKYVAKLSNHSLKDTTNRARLLYSRKKF